MKKITVSVCSDVGKKRRKNEDNFTVNGYYNEKSADFFEQDYKSSLPLVAAVFDGMGGTRNGGEASLLCARETTQLRQLIADCSDLQATVARFYSHLNKILLRRQVVTKAEYGTTACIVAVLKDKIIFSNAGDSAIFLISDGEICKKSTDDNQAQLLLDMNAITKEQALTHPMKNMLTQHLGTGLTEDSYEPEPHICVLDRRRGEELAVVICSDGVSGTLEPQKIKRLVRAQGSVAADLVDAALAAGSDDNATAVIIRIK